MALNSALMFSKASDEWRTPAQTFDALNAEFGFDHDAAATAGNSWVNGDYFGPDHMNPEQRDALLVDNWRPYGPVLWLNPPYSRCREFIEKAAREARKGCTVVALVPSRTDTRWWHSNVWNEEFDRPRPGVEVRFVKGRLKFAQHDGEPIRQSMRQKGGTVRNNSAPFPSVVIVFRPVSEQAAPHRNVKRE